MAFEMKGLRQIMRVSWTVKKTNLYMGSTAGRSGAISGAINQGKEVEVLWSCAMETGGIFGEGYTGRYNASDMEKRQTKDITER